MTPKQSETAVIANLWDTAGIEVSASSKLYKEGDLMRLLQGHFVVGTDLMARLDDRAKGYRLNPTEDQKIHAVIMCIASTDISDDDKTKAISSFNSIVRERGIPSVLVISKIDSYDPDLLDGGVCDPDDDDDDDAKPGEPLDMRQLYRSLPVKELLMEAEKKTGFALVDMAPIANRTMQDLSAIGVPKACHLAEMLLKTLNRAGRFRRQEAKFLSSSRPASAAAPARFDADSFVSAIPPYGVAVSTTQGSSGSGSSTPMLAVVIMVCRELGLTAPPETDLNTAVKEANESMGITPSGNKKEQVQKLVSELGLQVAGW
jgi:hypothetical protein